MLYYFSQNLAEKGYLYAYKTDIALFTERRLQVNKFDGCYCYSGKEITTMLGESKKQIDQKCSSVNRTHAVQSIAPKEKPEKSNSGN